MRGMVYDWCMGALIFMVIALSLTLMAVLRPVADPYSTLRFDAAAPVADSWCDREKYTPEPLPAVPGRRGARINTIEA